PCPAVIHAQRSALIARQQNDIGVVGINPDGVVVVAARSAFDRGETLTGVGGPIGRGVGDVDDVLVLGIDAHAGEVGPAAVDSLLGVDATPSDSGVVGTVEAASFPGFDESVHPGRIAGRDADSDSAESLSESRQAAGQRIPCGSAIGGSEKAAVGTGKVAVFPRALACLPQDGV